MNRKVQKCRDHYIWWSCSSFIYRIFRNGVTGDYLFPVSGGSYGSDLYRYGYHGDPVYTEYHYFRDGCGISDPSVRVRCSSGSEFLAMDGVTIVSRLIGMICISLPLYLIVLIIPEGFGGGDIKLMFAAGFLLGWKATVVGFFIGLILGGIYGVICLVRRSHGKNDHFAFGPFLSVGLAITLFCGNDLMNRYIDFLKAAMNPEM